MKKILIYPFFGSVLAGVAGATTVFVDGNQFCPNLCTENPGKNRCCPPNKTITKFDTAQFLSSSDNVFAGVTIGTGSDQQTIIDSEGNFVGTKNLSQKTMNAIKSAVRSSSSATKITQVAEYGNSDLLDITLDFRNGDGVATNRVYKGMTLPTPAREYRLFDGATFAGWYDGTTKVTKVDSDATNGKTYTAKWTCPPETSVNQYGVCIPNGLEYFTGENGEQIRSGEIDCHYMNSACNNDDPDAPYYDPDCDPSTTGHTGNSNYCDRTVIVHLHDQPEHNDGTLIYNLSVVNGNDGEGDLSTLWCNRVWCYVPHGAHPDGYNSGALVEKINMPRVDGYSFRGYFYRNEKNITDLVVDSTHNVNPNDVAAGQFYPKNNSDNPVSGKMGIYSPQDGINIWWDFADNSTSIQGLPVITSGALAGMHEINVYGGWAKHCEPGDNATCTLQKGISVAHSSNNLKPGQVRYDTGCSGAYHLSENQNAYNPTCVADEGQLYFEYAFVNQYGDSVSCNSAVTDDCTAGSNVSLLNTSNFATACGNDHTLRWLKANNKWYSPNRSVLCSSGTLGMEQPATVTGYVCSKCVSPEHGDCVDMPTGTTIHYNVSGNSTPSASVWGANAGSLNSTACKNIKCDDGYSMYKNPITGVRTCEEACPSGTEAISNQVTGERDCEPLYNACLLKCQQEGMESICVPDAETYCAGLTFNCPTSFQKPAGVTYTLEPGSGRSCTYAVGCSASGAVVENSNGTAVSTITCTGDNCTPAWLEGQFENLSCFVCPASGEVPTDISPVGPIQNGLECTYKAKCKNTSLTLYYNDTAVDSGLDQTTCTGTAGCYNAAGTGANSNLTNWYSGHSCATSSSSEFTCPELVQSVYGVDVNYTPTSQNGQCAYKASCTDTNGVCKSSLETGVQGKPRNLCEQQVCTGLSGCATLAALYIADNISCSANEPSWYMEFELPEGVTVAETGGSSN